MSPVRSIDSAMPPPETFGCLLATSVSVSCSFSSSGFAEQRLADAETDLRQARAAAHDDREGARADFEIERAGIACRDLVEFLGVIGDDAGEDIEAAGRALRIGRGRHVGRQRRGSPSAARCRRSRFRAPRLRRGRSHAGSAGRACRTTRCDGPGMKLARTRNALRAKRRSRLAGWIWSRSSSRSEIRRPVSNSAEIARSARIPVSRAIMPHPSFAGRQNQTRGIDASG